MRTLLAHSADPMETSNIAQLRSANPSEWRARAPIIVLTAIGLGLATYLAAYQLRFIGAVWEPFFGNGSERVLQSFISRLLPLPDALLEAIAYAVELIAAAVGGAARWREMPRVVLAYGVIVAAVALTGLSLAAVQLFVLHAGCTLCLTSAAISLIIAWLARDEVLASVRVMEEGNHS